MSTVVAEPGRSESGLSTRAIAGLPRVIARWRQPAANGTEPEPQCSADHHCTSQCGIMQCTSGCGCSHLTYCRPRLE